MCHLQVVVMSVICAPANNNLIVFIRGFHEPGAERAYPGPLPCQSINDVCPDIEAISHRCGIKYDAGAKLAVVGRATLHANK